MLQRFENHGRRAWLNEHRQNIVNKNLCSEADQTYAILGKLPWNSPQFGFDDCKPIHTLWRTLGTSWMNTSVIDAALEVINVKADVRFDLTSQTLIGHSDIITKLMFFFGGNIEKPKEYTSCDWLNNIRREVFQRGKRLLTIAHLGKLPAWKGKTKGADHWVPVGVDGSDLTFLYGDSMCGQKTPVMPPALFKAFTTWKSYHTSAEFTMAPIEITQQTDNTSCGPCALNAINCLAFPELDELAKPEDIACVRLRTLYNIISHVIDMADNTGISTASEASELTNWDDEDDESQESFKTYLHT
ncbi:hypothetical protein DFJ43DRAFT_1039883 [Lentinula guzmanii]|uniref:Ubiquitin-like protease family profile domain-containing protein n=1 Tax=Lentinula guzmanii TaxID=2804957 RepID=A0AA38MTE4_9AGAR|nr:hypothetical protein DFJ43DRAFT_1039883 [Lentinula guzmanii]